MDKKKIIPIFYMMMLLTSLLIAGTGMASSDTYYYENFGSPDATNGYPYSATGEIPYVYSTFGWSIYAGVNASAYTVNTSTTYADGWGNFTFNSSTAYNYFQFGMLYVDNNLLWQNHSGAELILYGNVGIIAKIIVYGGKASATGDQNTMLIYNYDGTLKLNITGLTNSTYYTIKIDPNYNTWANRVVVTVTESNSTTKGEVAFTMNGDASMSKFCVHETPVGTGKTRIFLDNFVALYTSYTSTDLITNNLLGAVLPVLLACAILIAIVSVALTGNLNASSMIGILISAVIGVITISIILGIL
jgi:hypothetical protein